jgi:hypothetical protein
MNKRSSYPEACVRALLALAMLLSPHGARGVEHVHADGNTRHSHAGAAVVPCDHHHAHDAGHHHEHCFERTRVAKQRSLIRVAQSATRGWHRHLAWFGTSLYVPLGPQDDSDGDSENTVAADVQSVGPAVLVSPGQFFTSAIALGSESLWVPILFIAQCSAPFRHVRTDAFLLCDTARHERSGVQLF